MKLCSKLHMHMSKLKLEQLGESSNLDMYELIKSARKLINLSSVKKKKKLETLSSR